MAWKAYQRFLLLPLLVLSFIVILLMFYSRWSPSSHSGSMGPLTLFHTTEYTARSQSNNSSPALIQGYPLSKDVVIHSVHYDDRSREGHKTIVLFLLDVKLSIFKEKLITKCGSERQETTNFKVRMDREDVLMHMFFGPKPYPYEEVVLECYDLLFHQGDHGYVWYKPDVLSVAEPLVTSSEEPIVIPSPPIKPLTHHNITILTCAKIHNKGAPYVSEFLRYQETIGIDHVYVTVLDSFIKDGGFQKLIATDSYVRDAIKKGYITIGVWREWYEDNDLYTHATSLEQMDCYYRYRGTYDYVFVLDTDDFFNPMLPSVTNVKDYVLQWCQGPGIGSCAFRWITYYPQACGLTTTELPKDGNITTHLKSHVNLLQGNPKSIHLTRALIDCSFHDAKCKECLITGYRVVDVPRESAYVAHIRNGQKPAKGC